MDRTDAPSDKASSLWTEARLRRLIVLWNDRLSAAQIARALGPGFSRSAVVGKLFRLGLSRSNEQRHDAQSTGARLARRRAGGNGLRPPAMPVSPLPPPTPCAVLPRLVGILDLPRRGCRWPYGGGEDVRFCGHPARPDSPYCPGHHAIAYVAVLPPLTVEAIALTRLQRIAPAKPIR